MAGQSQIPKMCSVLQPILQWDLCWLCCWFWLLDVQAGTSLLLLEFSLSTLIKIKVVLTIHFCSLCLCPEAQCWFTQTNYWFVFLFALWSFPCLWSHLPIMCIPSRALLYYLGPHLGCANMCTPPCHFLPIYFIDGKERFLVPFCSLCFYPYLLPDFFLLFLIFSVFLFLLVSTFHLSPFNSLSNIYVSHTILSDPHFSLPIL